MRLSDVMSSLRLTTYPEIGLVIFLVVFAAIALRTYARSRRDEMERFATLPLEAEAAPGAGDNR